MQTKVNKELQVTKGISLLKNTLDLSLPTKYSNSKIMFSPTWPTGGGDLQGPLCADPLLFCDSKINLLPSSLPVLSQVSL